MHNHSAELVFDVKERYQEPIRAFNPPEIELIPLGDNRFRLAD
jgi:hypothetical protein